MVRKTHLLRHFVPKMIIHFTKTGSGQSQHVERKAPKRERSVRREDIPKHTPIVMGEFGCNGGWYPNATLCTPHVRQLQISSCLAGAKRKTPLTEPFMDFKNDHHFTKTSARDKHRKTQKRVMAFFAGFSSWLFWTYDSYAEQQQYTGTQWYGMVDDDNAIGSVLAPASNPDPCSTAP
jgi:hypothetical protein